MRTTFIREARTQNTCRYARVEGLGSIRYDTIGHLHPVRPGGGSSTRPAVAYLAAADKEAALHSWSRQPVRAPWALAIELARITVTVKCHRVRLTLHKSSPPVSMG